MVETDNAESHVDNNADITISCVTMGNSRASDYGLVTIDGRGRIVQFSEKPKGADLKAMQTDTTLLGLSPQEALKSPYIASMEVYIFKTEVLLKLLRWRFPASNDFGSEIIPAAVEEHDVQVPKSECYDPKTPFYPSPRHLPPTKIDKCRIKAALISHGCFLRECTVQHLVIGECSRLDSGVELQGTVMLGTDYYQTETEIASLPADGNDVIIANKDGVEEADRPDEGFYIRSGITIIAEKATIKNGTVI
ncbi:glucose-1-phosphate adenylyltransferase large subunit 1-like isoform X3 [Hibiscus syriacus]|uniref:Glucose-1-phosphate adenylyltransferase large subunit 1-like isoform X3 n=1 Tax=Hibiscus syriacus TaxID=106335 RepID=A0A6A3A462_HIBSY|nr:glucose-1-phosphate adenylyltransferase large subunit 1-like isoform X3 [Hibiscus syriacus]